MEASAMKGRVMAALAKRTAFYFILSPFFFVAGPSFCLEVPEFNPIPKPVEALSALKADAIYLSASPKRMQRQNAVSILFYAGVTAGLLESGDEMMNRRFAKNDPSMPFDMPDIFSPIGDLYDNKYGQMAFIGLGASYALYGVVKKDRKIIDTSWLMAESFFFTRIATVALKWSLGRARPYAGEGADSFHFLSFSGKEEYKSMPSGHASGIFSLMTVLARQYDYWWIKLPAYTFAFSVGFQRIQINDHWPSDVLLGGLIGYSTATMLVNKYKGEATTGFSFVPAVYANGIGIRFSF
jgi:membrane-associated phospholipid phosphatase